MADHAVYDPYALKAENIQQPPTTFGATMKLIGPGLILASSIVGSGELIATTVLGAENGYILLWLILLSCIIKTVVQNELGRYAIATGKTTLEAFDQMPGSPLQGFVACLDVGVYGHRHAVSDRRDARRNLRDPQPPISRRLDHDLCVDFGGTVSAAIDRRQVLDGRAHLDGASL